VIGLPPTVIVKFAVTALKTVPLSVNVNLFVPPGPVAVCLTSLGPPTVLLMPGLVAVVSTMPPSLKSHC
jgi:hypothetical protein